MSKNLIIDNNVIGEIGVKICRLCFAEYEDGEVENTYQFCIECYGECIDANIVNKEEFLRSVTSDELTEKKNKVKLSPMTEHHKEILINRIKRLIEEKKGL